MVGGDEFERIAQDYDRLIRNQDRRIAEWRDRCREQFVGYLLREDQVFCIVPEHEAFLSQINLVKRIQRGASRN
jgi:hypothetical protein